MITSKQAARLARKCAAQLLGAVADDRVNVNHAATVFESRAGNSSHPSVRRINQQCADFLRALRVR